VLVGWSLRDSDQRPAVVVARTQLLVQSPLEVFKP
jgi:hypothetical protein